MNKPFEWTIQDYYPNKHIGIYMYDDPEDKIYDFMATRSLDTNYDYHLRFEVETTARIIQKHDTIFNNTPVDMLLSPRITDILLTLCPEQIQVFDAGIECKDGIVDTYKAINILNEVDVSDLQLSKFDYFKDGDIMGYKKFVIKDTPMEPIHIARDALFHPSIIISATLKEALEKAKIKGCRYWAGD